MMFTYPSRLQTLLLMLPAWAFAHAVLVLRVLPLGLNPFGKIEHPLHLTILYGLAAASGVFASVLAARRAHILGWSLPPLLSLLIHVPFFGAGLALWLAASGDESEQQSAAPTAVAGRLVIPFLLAFIFAIGLSVGLTYLEELQGLPFGLKKTGGYFGWAIFAGLPFAAGISTSVVIRRHGGTFAQALGAALTLIGAILLILCASLMEGIVCVLMAAPFGALLGFLGAAVGFALARRRVADGQLQAAAWLAIIALVGLEGWNPPAPLDQQVATEIIINAPAERIWAELHDIRDLPAPKEFLFVFGVAHPLATVTDGSGVGAARLCKLSTGDMPEIITVWKPNQELRFKVLATPPAMRELGFFGQTIDAAHLHSAYTSLEGGFRLIPLGDGRTKVIGESRYLLNLAPATYWNLWTAKIVHLVHRRVLEYVKSRAEAAPKA